MTKINKHRRVFDRLKRMVRHSGFPVSDASRFAVKFSGPDDPWTASLEIEWTWLGRGHWHCFFFPWWPNDKHDLQGN